MQSQLQAEAAARARREQLEWLASISTEHEQQLRTLLSKEAEEREAWRRAQQFCERLLEGDWDASQHPRRGGAPNAGWFASVGGAGTSGSRQDRPGTARDSNGADSSGAERQVATPDMLEMAHAWWQTQSALEQARRDLKELPKSIASEQAQLGSGGRYAYIHVQNLAKAQRDLAAAQA